MPAPACTTSACRAATAPRCGGTTTAGTRGRDVQRHARPGVNKAAWAYTVNDMAGSHNGAAVVTDTTGRPCRPALTTTRLGRSSPPPTGSGYLRRLVYFNTRLPNATLVTLTGATSGHHHGARGHRHDACAADADGHDRELDRLADRLHLSMEEGDVTWRTGSLSRRAPAPTSPPTTSAGSSTSASSRCGGGRHRQRRVPAVPKPLPVNYPNTYERVAASQTAQVLGSGLGGIGDYIAGVLVVPATTSPGAVTLLDGATSMVVFTGGAIERIQSGAVLRPARHGVAEWCVEGDDGRQRLGHRHGSIHLMLVQQFYQSPARSVASGRGTGGAGQHAGAGGDRSRSQWMER